jgi:hypothetical protein
MWHQILRRTQRTWWAVSINGERNMRICFKVVWMLLGGVALSGAASHGFHAEENLALISSLLSERWADVG